MSDTSLSNSEPSGSEAPAADTPEVQVRALGYIQLRELAENSAGVLNQTVDFYFPDGRVLRRADAGQQFGDHDVVIPAYNRGKFPRNTLTLTVGDTPPNGGVRTLTGADAVFWSDAAVHKFLIPYAASFAGESAGEWVTDVQNAWNNYPTDEVTVYALVHMTSTEAGMDLDPSFALLVGHVPAGGTEVLYATVPEFLARYKPVTPTPPKHVMVPYRRSEGPLGPQRPDYAELRAMAEWAASLRDEAGYFRFRSGERGFDPPVSHLGELGSGDFVVPTHTPTIPEKRPMLKGVFFQAEGEPEATNVADKGDALFWSTGSIEQFVVPYYASKGGLKSLPDLGAIATIWETTGPGRRAHSHSDHPVPVEGGEGAQAEAVAGEVQVYGIIHLPTSQWTEVEAGFTVTTVSAASQLMMLSITRRGRTRMRRPHFFTGHRR